jgi:hypothetical protein
MKPTKQQRERAARALMRAIHVVEAAQNTASVRACNVDQARINSAKDTIYSVVQQIERGER